MRKLVTLYPRRWLGQLLTLCDGRYKQRRDIAVSEEKPSDSGNGAPALLLNFHFRLNRFDGSVYMASLTRTSRTFTITVLGRLLELLGLQMYKRRDIALAELVANCWD